MERTLHSYDRLQRENFIRQNIGFGKKFASFVWDRGHANGAEIHVVTTTGIVCIYNQRTKKLVTTLIARPQQIRRYFNGSNPAGLESIVNLAYEHQQKGWNEM